MAEVLGVAGLLAEMRELYNGKTRPLNRGWNLFRYPTIKDGVVFRWKFGDGEVSASRHGVTLSGRWPMWTERSGDRETMFDGLKESLDEAYGAYEALRQDNDWDPAVIGTSPVFAPPFGYGDEEAPLRHPEQVAEFFAKNAAEQREKDDRLTIFIPSNPCDIWETKALVCRPCLTAWFFDDDGPLCPVCGKPGHTETVNLALEGTAGA